MRRFQFSLEALFLLRETRLEQAEAKLAVAVSEYNREQQKLRANREAGAQAWAGLHGDVLNPAEASLPASAGFWKRSHSGYLYLERLEKQGREIDESMHEAHAAMEAEQKRYTDMRKDLRVLERLRERQYGQYKRKAENRRDEETAQMSAAHSRKSLKQRDLFTALSIAGVTEKEGSWSIT